MIARALNALGFGRKPVEVTQRSTADAQLIEKLKYDAEKWRESACHWGERFSSAATDLAKQAEEIEAYKEGAKALSRIIDSGVEEIEAQQGLVSALTDKNVELVGKLETARGERDAAMADALLWRNARDKRSRNRRGVKTNG